MSTASMVLPVIWLPWTLNWSPPMVFWRAPNSRETPVPLGRATVPLRSVPMRLPTTWLFRPDRMARPMTPELPPMMLPSPTTPMSLRSEVTLTPSLVLGTAAVPAALVPTRSPRTVLASPSIRTPMPLPEIVSPGPMATKLVPARTWTPVPLARADDPPSFRPIRLPTRPPPANRTPSVVLPEMRLPGELM